MHPFSISFSFKHVPHFNRSHTTLVLLFSPTFCFVCRPCASHTKKMLTKCFWFEFHTMNTSSICVLFHLNCMEKKPFRKIRVRERELVTTFLKWEIYAKKNVKLTSMIFETCLYVDVFKAMRKFLTTRTFSQFNVTHPYTESKGKNHNKYLVTSKWFDGVLFVLCIGKGIEFEQQQKNIWFVIFCGTFFAKYTILCIRRNMQPHNTICLSLTE